MNQIAVQTSTENTISSIDLLALINKSRLEEGRKYQMRHDNFLKKIETEFGEHALNFKGMMSVDIGNGGTRESPCYFLPRREAEILVMSESTRVRAAVYDRMRAPRAASRWMVRSDLPVFSTASAVKRSAFDTSPSWRSTLRSLVAPFFVSGWTSSYSFLRSAMCMARSAGESSLRTFDRNSPTHLHCPKRAHPKALRQQHVGLTQKHLLTSGIPAPHAGPATEEKDHAEH